MYLTLHMWRIVCKSVKACPATALGSEFTHYEWLKSASQILHTVFVERNAQLIHDFCLWPPDWDGDCYVWQALQNHQDKIILDRLKLRFFSKSVYQTLTQQDPPNGGFRLKIGLFLREISWFMHWHLHSPKALVTAEMWFIHELLLTH